MVMEGCRNCGVRPVITLCGGYADPISRTAGAHANPFRTAALVYGISRS
jgi:hypothetical protein